MSSHREAPEILNDPAADSTDLYAFVTPDYPETVTLVANYVPNQRPAAGPNFFEFGTDVRYDINIANSGDATPDITYSFRFRTETRDPNTFLYSTGPINSVSDDEFNRPQFFTVTRSDGSNSETLAEDLPVPPCHVGPRSTPDYEALVAETIHDLPDGIRVFAGQRNDAFQLDLGSVFDLGTLRPLQEAHLIPMANADGVSNFADLNVFTIAIQVPIEQLTRSGSRPDDPLDEDAVIGVWTTASRQRARVFKPEKGGFDADGSFVQVSRLGMPLINEVVIPLGQKDPWNASQPQNDEQFLEFYERPILAQLLPVLYPEAFPNLEQLNEDADRADLVAILLTGIPEGIIDGFQNFTGETPADLLRLNVAIPPSEDPDPLGLIAEEPDPAGFPNGRRIGDDVTTISLRAVAGVTFPLIDEDFEPDEAAGAATDGADPIPSLDTFPFMGTPLDGFTFRTDEAPAQ